MDVAFAANRPGIAELSRDALDGADDITFRLCLRIELLDFSKSHRGKHGAGPSAKILGGKIHAGCLAQIIVHISRIHAALFAITVDILEELLTWRVLDIFEDFVRRRV